MIESKHRLRTFTAAGTLLVALAALGFRVCLLHLGPNDHLKARISEIRRYEEERPAPRGRILDRQGRVLALDVVMNDVWVDPKEIMEAGHVNFAAMHLARLLALDKEFVLSRLTRTGSRFQYLRRNVPLDEARAVQRLQLKGVYLQEVTARSYPHGSLACHVVGFVNMDRQGAAGIEQRFHSMLRGRPGWRVGVRDGRRREIYSRRMLDVTPEPGVDVYLTIDRNLQYVVERALDRVVEAHQAKGAWAIVQDVRTGEILAMASRPGFDLNEYNLATPTQMLNRAIGYVYEPGSTFKVATIAAALNEGKVTPQQTFDCENGCWFFNGRPLRDFHPYGVLSVADILKKSSNIGAAKITMLMDARTVEHYLRQFGFGRPTGIELPGEEGGVLRERSRWTSLSLSRIAMGHEIGVTALQMLNMLCSIANDGVLVRPTIVRRITDSQGRVLMETRPEFVARPLRQTTARLMSELLSRVVEPGGTGTRAAVEGYSVAGKTGTAEKFIDGAYSSRANVSSFMGFLPVSGPDRVGIIVVVDEPQGPARTGGVVAAPAFAEIAQWAVRWLDIPPDQPTVLAGGMPTAPSRN